MGRKLSTFVRYREYWIQFVISSLSRHHVITSAPAELNQPPSRKHKLPTHVNALQPQRSTAPPIWIHRVQPANKADTSAGTGIDTPAYRSCAGTGGQRNQDTDQPNSCHCNDDQPHQPVAIPVADPHWRHNATEPFEWPQGKWEQRGCWTIS